MASHITPTFLLKGLDYKKLVADYNSGFFSRIPSQKTAIKESKTTPTLAQGYGVSNHDSIFSVKDKYNSNVVIATIGHTDFEVFTKTGGKLSPGGRCDFCKEDIKGVGVGYPVRSQEMTFLETNEKGESRYKVVYVFWVEGKTCDFQCCLGYLKKDANLHEYEYGLRMLYKLSYPNAGSLTAAQDPRLLISNGGCLTKEQWKDKRHEYVCTDRVLMIPAKREYIRQDYL